MEVVEQLVLRLDHSVSGLNLARGEILSDPKWSFIA